MRADLALAVLAASATAGAAGPSWSFRVAFDPATGLADVAMDVDGWSGARVCLDMPGAGAYASAVEERVGDGWRALARDPDDDDCFRLLPSSGRLALRYHDDLGAMARAHGDVDYATRLGDGWVFQDEALLARPDPLPPGAPISVALALPPGVSAVGPWRTPYDSDQYEAGGYVAVGHLRALGDLAVGGGRAAVTLVDGPHAASDAQLVAWLRRALDTDVAFYGELPGRDVSILVAPVAGETRAGVFGSVLRRGRPSVVLLFGADATAGFARDWVATHELFHLGNPPLARRVPWIVEGLTTYYQDVLRGRARVWPPDEMWGDMADNLRRDCPVAGRRSLVWQSDHVAETHRYQDLYWGGACLFLAVDVAIRERSRGARSLDDVARALRHAKAPLDEDDVVAALDRAAGGPVARDILDGKRPVRIDALLARLGVREGPGDAAGLDDKAPLAAIRRAIMAE